MTENYAISHELKLYSTDQVASCRFNPYLTQLWIESEFWVPSK